MYIALVDYFDTRGEKVDYGKLFLDIRASIDEAHRDDTLKNIISANLDAYFFKDLKLAECLHKHRWNQSKAADELGLSRVGLANKIRRYGLAEAAP